MSCYWMSRPITSICRPLNGWKGCRPVPGRLAVDQPRSGVLGNCNRTYWIERGRIYRRGFPGFTEWADKILADEESQQHKLNRKIAEETRWLREGLTARRKRNEGRVTRLLALSRR